MTQPPRYPLVLASASPRRRQLLENVGLSFDVLPTDVDETPLEDETPFDLVRRLSLAKAEAAAAQRPDACIIAADTVVVFRGELLGKPQDEAQNRDFIQRLSGRSHAVLTGHALRTPEARGDMVVQSAVRFRTLSELEIDWYAGTGEGRDKAGGYAIQGYGSALVREVRGCYFNVVGLSVAHLLELSQRVGVELGVVTP